MISCVFWFSWQRFWRKKREHRMYLTRIMMQYKQTRELVRRKSEVHRALMKHQEDMHHRLVNRIRMFDCADSKPKLRQYIAARCIQCAIRCQQARKWTEKLVTAACTIQKHYRSWVGSRVAGWKLRLHFLRSETDQVQLFRRQKFVATSVADQELEILESYSEIEKEMLTCRNEIEVQDQTAERLFKKLARKAKKSLDRADIGDWVPQAGAVSGKAHYMHALTGEVMEEHPHQKRIDEMVAALRSKVDAQQRPLRNKMLGHLENLKGRHEEVYAKVADTFLQLRELTFRAQFH
jgi:hypothetical protein